MLSASGRQRSMIRSRNRAKSLDSSARQRNSTNICWTSSYRDSPTAACGRGAWLKTSPSDDNGVCWEDCTEPPDSESERRSPPVAPGMLRSLHLLGNAVDCRSTVVHRHDLRDRLYASGFGHLARG